MVRNKSANKSSNQLSLSIITFHSNLFLYGCWVFIRTWYKWKKLLFTQRNNICFFHLVWYNFFAVLCLCKTDLSIILCANVCLKFKLSPTTTNQSLWYKVSYEGFNLTGVFITPVRPHKSQPFLEKNLERSSKCVFIKLFVCLVILLICDWHTIFTPLGWVLAGQVKVLCLWHAI